jgi:pyruvate kinase
MSFKKNSLLKNIISQTKDRKTDIICTIGLNNSKEFIGGFIKNGMNIMRVHCSHGNILTIKNLLIISDNMSIKIKLLV